MVRSNECTGGGIALTTPNTIQNVTPRWSASGLLTTIEAAAWLGVSRHSLNQWRSTGRGPRFVNVGRSIRYRLADLQAYASAPVRSTSERDARAVR